MSKPKISVNYGRNFLFLNSLYSYFIKNKRDEIFRKHKSKFKFNKKTKLLDVGTTSSLDEHENIILKKFKWQKNISCLSNQNLKNLKKKYPEINLYKGDAKKMKFKNNTYDVVYSSATIEHVGSFKNQIKFIRECIRVSKRLVFIATPNRYFPIDFHTRLPLLHFLPKPIHRTILKLFGENFLSKEENLNLLSKADLKKICKLLNIKNFKIYDIKLFNFVSNIILIIYK